MLCPICEGKIKEESKYCGKCGSMIPRCPTCGKVITKKINFCTNDGTPIPESIIALFSDDLGVKANTISNKSIQSDKRPKKKKYIFTIIAVLLIFVLLCVSITAGYVYFYDRYPWEAIMSIKNQEKVRVSALEIPKQEVPSSESISLTEAELPIVEALEQVTAAENELDMLDDTIAESENDEAIILVEDKLEYFITHCDAEYFSREDLISFDADICRLARNGIYAWSGRKFDDDMLQTYFSKYDWYEPTIAPNDFSESMLNEYQIANRDLIVEYEKEVVDGDSQ